MFEALGIYDIGNPVLYSKGYERAISKNLTYTILEP
jgi:hypothetical protein